MKLRESRLRAIIRQIIIEARDDDEEKLPGWKPPWEGGGSGAGGHAGAGFFARYTAVICRTGNCRWRWASTSVNAGLYFDGSGADLPANGPISSKGLATCLVSVSYTHLTLPTKA